MDQPDGTQDASNGATADKQIVSPIIKSCAEKQQEPKETSGQNDTATAKYERPKNTFRRKARRYFLKLCREGPDRHIELALALVITIFAVVQWFTVKSNNDSATQQTDQLITAAKISALAAKENAGAAQQIADASRRNAIAAQSFSGSAAGINGGISDAVEKLQTQADRIEAARVTSEKSSRDALKATIENSRSDLRAYVTTTLYRGPLSEECVFAQRLCADVQYINVGRTPAVNLEVKAVLVPYQGPGEQVPEGTVENMPLPPYTGTRGVSSEHLLVLGPLMLSLIKLASSISRAVPITTSLLAGTLYMGLFGIKTFSAGPTRPDFVCISPKKATSRMSIAKMGTGLMFVQRKPTKSSTVQSRGLIDTPNICVKRFIAIVSC